MKKAKFALIFTLTLVSISVAYAFKARSFIGYISVGGIFAPVWVSASCPELGPGCVYTTNNMTYQIYTLSGSWMNPVRP
jgi:hypothetical protein